MWRLLKRARVDTKITLVSVYVTCIRPVVEYEAQVWHYIMLLIFLAAEVKRIQSLVAWEQWKSSNHFHCAQVQCTSFSFKEKLSMFVWRRMSSDTSAYIVSELVQSALSPKWSLINVGQTISRLVLLLNWSLRKNGTKQFQQMIIIFHGEAVTYRIFDIYHL